jgi:hypothetical protein
MVLVRGVEERFESLSIAVGLVLRESLISIAAGVYLRPRLRFDEGELVRSYSYNRTVLIMDFFDADMKASVPESGRVRESA